MLKRLALVSALACCMEACAAKCEEHFKVDRGSPEGYIVATLFVRDCGAFAESVSHVNLRDSGERLAPGPEGRITAGEVFAAEGNHTIYLIWKDERHLSIECVGCGAKQVLKSESTWRGVQVSYVAR